MMMYVKFLIQQSQGKPSVFEKQSLEPLSRPSPDAEASQGKGG